MAHFNLYSFIPFAAFYVNSLLATYLFAKRRTSRINNAFYLFTLTLAFWSLGDFLLWLKINPDWYITLLRLQSIFWIPVGFLFLNFAYAFIRRRRNLIYWLFFSLTLLAVVLALFTDLVNRGYREEPWGVIHGPGPLFHWIVLGPVLISMLYGVYILFIRMLQTQDATERMRINIVVFGTALTSIFAVFSAVLIPDIFQILDMPSTHDVALMFYALIMFIAIEKYSFLKIRVADVANDMFAKMRDGIVIINKSEEVQHINPSAMKMLNIPFISSQDKSRIRIQDYIEHMPELRAFSNVEIKPRYQGIDEKVLLISKSPVIDTQGVAGSLILFRDITHQKQYDEEIRTINEQLAMARDDALEASHLKSQFLANMSHELRTPLNAVIGYSEIIEEEAADEDVPHIAEDAKKINIAGKHLLTLINDILDLSKIEAGKMDLYLTRFSIQDLINDVLVSVQPLLDKNANVLEVNIENDVNIIADETKLRQVLMNLLSNAAKFTEQGKITLQVIAVEQQDQTTVHITVSDSGIGMTQEQLQRVFNSFSQADASTTRKYGGTGLGLAISQRMMEMMCGEIRATSEFNKGSCFTVVLPVDVEAANARQQHKQHGATAQLAISEKTVASDLARLSQDLKDFRQILIVDDDAATREILLHYLEAEGLIVHTASGGQEALRLARVIRPDVITLDVMMPDLDGWAVLRELKADPQLQEIPVIMITMVDDKPAAFANGVTDYLIKPVPRPQLVDMVQKLLHSQDNSPILLIDDDAEIREMMRLILEDEGYKVLEAMNGEDALAVIAEQEPALVLLDMNMPVMNGFEFLDVFRKDMRYRDIPAIVLTSTEIDAEQLNALNRGEINILGKDKFTAENLLHDVKKHIQ